MKQRFFTACHKDSDVCRKSASGGAFTAITDQWFAAFGESAVIYGCAWGENLQPRHIRATDPSARDKMRGSKYIGSEMSMIFRQVADDIENEKNVAFSGTPCQIAGLKSFLNVKGIGVGEKLLTIEVICHGVASSKFFRDYIEHLEKKYKAKAISCNFRSKSRPGKIQDLSVTFDNGKKYQASSTRYDWFYSAYNSKNLILRPSCYHCEYARPERVADISIGDHWGDQAVGMGKSLIIANTPLGLQWIQRLSGNMVCQEIASNQVHQDRMNNPCMKPHSYDQFWQIYRSDGYLAAQRFLGNNTTKGRLKSMAAGAAVCLGMDTIVKKLKKY